jgi:hypothetical protein
VARQFGFRRFVSVPGGGGLQVRHGRRDRVRTAPREAVGASAGRPVLGEAPRPASYRRGWLEQFQGIGEGHDDGVPAGHVGSCYGCASRRGRVAGFVIRIKSLIFKDMKRITACGAIGIRPETLLPQRVSAYCRKETPLRAGAPEPSPKDENITTSMVSSTKEESKNVRSDR